MVLRPRRDFGAGPWVASAWVIGVALATVILTFLTPAPPGPVTDTFIPLYSSGITVRDDGERESLPPRASAQPSPSAAGREWLAQGSVPAAGTPNEEMSVRALLDIDALALPVRYGKADVGPQRYALIAAWQDNWHYVWPRDASFAAVALARSGHLDQAWGILSYLQDVQSGDGTFQARYLPADIGSTPDDRAAQTDGIGWVLWAARQVLAEAPAARRGEIRSGLDLLISRASAAALRLTDDGRRLPPISPDYWEVREYRLTLGTAGPLLIALQSAAHLGSVGAATAAVRYRDLLVATFGSQGYPRQRGWVGSLGASAPDTAVNFVRRPFVDEDLPGAAAAWQASQAAMVRPGGGLAPGGSWRNDGISWTPTTSIYALVAACSGDTAQARTWLAWLEAHRTEAGSLPEKVLSDGTPASVAPLAWTSANVLIALSCLPGPDEDIGG
ncbi:hypothetical protein GCM10010401_22050 [Rarobacter faecitabidus]|uniref:GH15 family glucan-1,4-alpha-glucosidase n=2 Tax=Rarobacter faecitabidus TaxID=13243 RepID=A0A542ZVS9_RARFA|nr:hypothetical protein FB461_0911 [Rarobacter faecitabidus]